VSTEFARFEQSAERLRVSIREVFAAGDALDTILSKAVDEVAIHGRIVAGVRTAVDLGARKSPLAGWVRGLRTGV
jgi:hypothetical protein